MGAVEIVFSTIAFFVIWFLIFKFKLMYDEKKAIQNINKKLEDQDKKVFNIKGRKVQLGAIEEVKESEATEPKEEKPKPNSKKKVVKKATKKKATKIKISRSHKKR